MQSLDGLTGVSVFETERLRCRRWLPSDRDAIYRVYSDPEGSRWVGDGSPITRAACERWLHVTAENYATRGYGMFALDDRNTAETLGFCGLVHPSGQVDVEIKYAFLRSHWGEGLASEVVPELLTYAATRHRLDRVIATVDPGHLASQRVLLKSGFEFERSFNDESGAVYVYVWHAVDEPEPSGSIA